MAFRFTIGKKIGTGFGILLLLTLIVFTVTYFTLQESRNINNRITNVNTPSVKALQELKFSILQTQLLSEKWIKIPDTRHQVKTKLKRYWSKEYPIEKETLRSISSEWENEDQKGSLKMLFDDLDELYRVQKTDVMDILATIDDYDAANQFLATNSVEEGGEVYLVIEKSLNNLNDLIEQQKALAAEATEKMNTSFSNLRSTVVWLGFALVLIGLIVAIVTTKNIVNPIYTLKNVAVKLGRGVFPQEAMEAGEDEIGEMTIAMNNVVDGLKRTKDFAQEVGSGNFDTEYKPLSNKDSLGKALLKMRDDLAENERFLEEKVRQRTAEVVKQKEEIDLQKEQIEEYFIQVTDSIKYAQKIQEAILPPESYVRRLLPDSFIFYKPKDIVSGDFYWLGEAEDRVYFAAVDCTGHGVPGAFMSIIGYNQLKQAIITTNGGTPAQILDHLNVGVTETLHQKDENSTSKDGMDIAICSLNHKTKELQFAGAFNPLYLLRNGEIIQTKGDKYPIGSFLDGATPNFTNNTIQLEKGDQLYIFSDGYADQFGGPRGKKMMYKKFRDTLIANSEKDLSIQKDMLKDNLLNWMGEEEQVDDILVIGVKV